MIHNADDSVDEICDLLAIPEVGRRFLHGTVAMARVEGEMAGIERFGAQLKADFASPKSRPWWRVW